jgi:hypothetical protein
VPRLSLASGRLVLLNGGRLVSVVVIRRVLRADQARLYPHQKKRDDERDQAKHLEPITQRQSAVKRIGTFLLAIDFDCARMVTFGPDR